MARPPLIAISTGCPAGIGPEVSVAAAWKLRALEPVLVGDLATLRAAARLVGVAPERLVPVEGDRRAERRGAPQARDVAGACRRAGALGARPAAR